jgi:hypothetical protein
MSSAKALAWGVLVWVSLGTVGRADSLSSFGGWNLWQAWGQGEFGSSTLVVPFLNSGSPPAPAITLGTPQTPTLTTSNTESWSAAPQQTPAPAPSPAPAPATMYDALINMGAGPFPEANVLTTGGAQPWYDSPAVQSVFGGIPNAQQQASFVAEVLSDVQASFRVSGVPVTLTTDPNASAAHTVSVVSNTSYGPNPNAIGIADLGNNGFSFIDKFGSAQSVDDLAEAVAHNVAHEIMHSFGVPEQPNTKGFYVDNESTTWPILTTPNLPFSPTVINLLHSLNFQNNSSSTNVTGAPQVVGDDDTLPAHTVPEPATMTLWVLGTLGVITLRKRCEHSGKTD